MNSPSPSKKNLAIVWLALVVMHFTILGTAMLRLHGAGTPIIIMLAVIQMVLVLLVFMEVRHRVRLFWIFASAGFFWLVIQWTLTMSDYLTRQWH